MAFLAPIELHHFLSVDGVQSIRIDHHTEQSRVSLNRGKIFFKYHSMKNVDS